MVPTYYLSACTYCNLTLIIAHSNKLKLKSTSGIIIISRHDIITEGFSKKVRLDTMDSMEQKIDKLMVMMGKLVMEDEGQNRQFKP